MREHVNCKKDVEDEIHFVCVCPALELIRMKYFKILNIDKSELLIDQLSRVLTHMNVNMERGVEKGRGVGVGGGGLHYI